MTQLIHLKLIDDNPYQDREVYEEIEDLGRTIALNDLQQTPKARKCGARYQLKFGHRRKRAFDWLQKHYQAEGLQERYEGYTVMPLDVEDATDTEMFDVMVIENAHRKDLKPTEKIRLLKRYKEQHPTSTSKDIGLVFNMEDATVRGLLALDDLHEEGKAALDAGKISQGTARTLKSVQRIAPKEKIAAIIKKVEKNADNRLPEEIIEEEIGHLNNVVELWDESRRDGKPRSHWSNGWLLDMRNFPNHLLPAMNEQAVGQFEKQIEHLVNPPACTVCPFYTKVRGSHYCGLKICHERKTIAWHESLLQQASKTLGIAIYEKEDGKYVPLDSSYHRPLFNSKHKDLRLIATRIHGSRGYQYFEGIESEIGLVVATGEAIAKMKSRGSQVAGTHKTDKEKAEMRMMKIYRMRRKELMWEYTAAAKGMFDTVPLSVLRKLGRCENIGIDDRIPDEHEVPDTGKADAATKAEFKRRELVWRLIMSACTHYHRVAMTAALKEFEERTGVKPPKSLLKKAEEWDAEIKAAGSVSTATKGK